MLHNPIIDAFEGYLLRYFTYLQTIRIKDMITMFTAFFAGIILALYIFLRIWVKARVVFENIKDPNIIIFTLHKGDIYETQVRSDAFNNISSILNVTFALLIANHSHNTKVYIGEVKKLEKIAAIVFFIALLLAVFGFMCALDTQLPPGYKMSTGLFLINLL